MDNFGRVELLAPAGNPEGLYGAIHAGADAVYLGGSRFGARAYAENFSSEELVRCIRYAHLMGRKVYLTVNTLLKEKETEELRDYLLPFYEAELDAVIVQDLGVLRLVREQFPGLKIHASTQMTLCSGHGVSLLKEMGVSRVVPARELGLWEILYLKEQASCGFREGSPPEKHHGSGPQFLKGEASPPEGSGSSGMEIECFIHGAMCYCYSGQCLFSSILGGRSGNRGRCAQPCRLPYAVREGGTELAAGHLLSLKDMCTIEHVPRLVEAGIDSFKIEGRMKKPEYAAGVTEIYRRCVDKYYELGEKLGPEGAAEAYVVAKEDWKALRSLYIRSEVQDGYYYKRNGRNMITMSSPAYSGSDEELLLSVRKKHIESPLKLPVSVKADFQIGKPVEIVFGWNGGKDSEKETVSCRVIGEMVGKAKKQPISEEDAASRLGRLGDSALYAREMKVSVEEGCFYPLGQINELRRAAAAQLEEKILLVRGYGGRGFSEGGRGEGFGAVVEDSEDARRDKAKPSAPLTGTYAGEHAAGYAVSVRTMGQLEAVVGWLSVCKGAGDAILRIYVDADLVEQDGERVAALCGPLGGGCGIYAALPYILRASDDAYLEDVYRRVADNSVFSGFLVRSMDGLGFLREKGTWREGRRIACRADAGVYVWNRQAAEELEAVAEGFCLPWELNASEQRGLCGGRSWEKIVYGRIPMMLTANCLRRTAGKCAKGDGAAPGAQQFEMELIDRYRKNFPVVANCRHCMNIIYNSVPLSLFRELPKWRGKVDLRIDFTLESPEETRQILDSFIKGAAFLECQHTSGHERRGVE